jgi:hypothetical protein
VQNTGVKGEKKNEPVERKKTQYLMLKKEMNSSVCLEWKKKKRFIKVL